MKNKIRYGIIALAIAGLGYYAYHANRAPVSAAAGPGAAPPAMSMAVEVARLAPSDFSDDVTAVGSLKSNESVILRPETPGRVAAIHFRDGAVVNKGDVLISLDAAVQEAELQQARANLALARSNYQRSTELLERKFISQQALDSTGATLKVQEAAVQLAEAKLARMRIKAPFKGVVGLRNVSVGDYVKEAADLINIEDIGSLRVDFKLPEAYIGRLTKGQVAELSSDALPGTTFKAELAAVDPLVDQGGRSLSVRARLDNTAGKLRPGMFVRVRLLFGERQGVLMLPEQAVVPGGQPAVYKLVDGKVALVKVRLGVRRTAQVEVLEGLAAGDVVVTAGQLRLRDGMAVRPVGDDGAAPARAPTGTAAGK